LRVYFVVETASDFVRTKSRLSGFCALNKLASEEMAPPSVSAGLL